MAGQIVDEEIFSRLVETFRKRLEDGISSKYLATKGIVQASLVRNAGATTSEMARMNMRDYGVRYSDGKVKVKAIFRGRSKDNRIIYEGGIEFRELLEYPLLRMNLEDNPEEMDFRLSPLFLSCKTGERLNPRSIDRLLRMEVDGLKIGARLLSEGYHLGRTG